MDLFKHAQLILYLSVIIEGVIVTELTLVSFRAVTIERSKCVNALSPIFTIAPVTLIYILVTSVEVKTAETSEENLKVKGRRIRDKGMAMG